jgi:dipeptidyl aminopeptidase/acylaminoacyl peptidase
MSKIASYGSWQSPVSAEWLTLSQKRFGTIVLDGETIYWDELRPNENGRYVVVQYANGEKKDVTPESMSVRSRVHEYGGASFTVFEGKVYYVNDKDQRIYLETDPLTEPGVRFADLHVIGPYLIAVGEKGHDNFLIALHLPTKKWTKIASGNDFYASPAISPDGSKIAFLTWNQPNMPWDAAELWVGEFTEGKLHNLEKIAGSDDESIFQPSWSPTGVLHFVSDKTGWWNIYRWDGISADGVDLKEAETGLPQWVFGMSTYAFSGESIYAASVKDGKWSLSLSGKQLDLPWTLYTQIRACHKFAVFLAGSPMEDKAIIMLQAGKTKVIAHNVHPKLADEFISKPEFLTYPSSKGRVAHAFYYAPKNADYQAPPNTYPPLLVTTHGGPTAATAAVFDLKVQYWTSRGFAVLDVDYAGSTGYGRPYRDALKGTWGIADVEDAEAGARYLIEHKKADPERIAIRGGSAGGYTTLAALTFGSTFTVGASYYGVSDLVALAEETHKFEARYLDSLIGPYPASKKVYQERSPLFCVDRLRCPVIFFQGSEDKIVPLNQAKMLYDALKKRDIPTELIVYEGEQHGFRKSENIRDSLEKELAFYLHVWGAYK